LLAKGAEVRNAAELSREFVEKMIALEKEYQNM